ncbi:hypothetical protein V1224_11240 [Lachnospiraceae bacterium JLR.KK008]
MAEDRTEKQAAKEDVENIMRLLDTFAAGSESRMKLDVSESAETGTMRKAYHHGRCDVGSPWANGTCYDAPEPED